MNPSPERGVHPNLFDDGSARPGASMLLNDFQAALEGNATAIRFAATLEPLGSASDKLFPIESFESRRLSDDMVESLVVLDSVADHAARIRSALHRNLHGAWIKLPAIEFRRSAKSSPANSTFDGSNDEGAALTRAFSNAAFRNSPEGQHLARAGIGNATPFYEWLPTALLFGAWPNPGTADPRIQWPTLPSCALISEVVGHKIEIGGPPLSAEPGWKEPLTDIELIGKGRFAPRRTPLPDPPKTGGVTIAYAKQTAIISFLALRKLRFPIEDKVEPALETAARLVLIALSLVGLTLQYEEGYDFRSRCSLVPVDEPTFDLIGATTSDVIPFKISPRRALTFLTKALELAETCGLTWRRKPLVVEIASADTLRAAESALATPRRKLPGNDGVDKAGMPTPLVQEEFDLSLPNP